MCLRHSWGAPIAVQANCTDAALAMNSRQHLPRLGHAQSPPQGLTGRMQHRTQQAGTWPCPAPRCLAAAGGQPHQSHQPQFPTPLPFSTPFHHHLLPLGMTLPCERLPPPHPRPSRATGKCPYTKPQAPSPGAEHHPARTVTQAQTPRGAVLEHPAVPQRSSHVGPRLTPVPPCASLTAASEPQLPLPSTFSQH